MTRVDFSRDPRHIAHKAEALLRKSGLADTCFIGPSTWRSRRSNRSPAIRMPMNSKNPTAKRLEFRCPDPSCNGYLAWSAMLMAMIDGIQNRLDPGTPLDRDLYEMTRGEVFTTDVIQTWIDYKKERR